MEPGHGYSMKSQEKRDIFNDIDMSTLYRKKVECDLNLGSITYSTTFLDLGKKSKSKVALDDDDLTSDYDESSDDEFPFGSSSATRR